MLLLLLLLLSLGGSQSQKEGYEMRVSRSETVQEGLCIYIPCSFTYPNSWLEYSAIYGYWYRKRSRPYEDVLVATNNKHKATEKDAEGRFHLVGDITEDNCSLSITDVKKEDSGQYYLRIEKWDDGFNYADYQVNLNVKALTQKPDIYSPGILEPGHPVTLMCAAPWVCGEGTPPIFSWIGAALSNLNPSQRTPYFSKLTLIPRPQDHGTKLTCRMTFPAAGVQTETSVLLNVASKTKSDSLPVYIGAYFACKITAFLAFCLILTRVKFLRKEKREEDGEIQDRKKVGLVPGVPLDLIEGFQTSQP